MYLEKINSPSDLKNFNSEERKILADEMRAALLQKMSSHGGHFGPNFGMVEMTIALHSVFDSPKDKFIFDVSHQSYGHKMLTGRKAAFLEEDQYDAVSGYTEPAESKHDFFTIGHTSTSVSLAAGMAKARDLAGGQGNILAIIGDGSLSGGEALEALNFAGEQDKNFIVIVNDNEMSIAENHGGMYRNLKELRDTNGQASNNLFKAMGLDYRYLEEGHDIDALIEFFQASKDIDHPIVLHIHTVKGKGYRFAEENKEAWHFSWPFDIETGKAKGGLIDEYADLTARHMLEKMKQDSKVVMITSATPFVCGFSPERRAEAGHQFIDVGIAEEHAVALASGIAANGGRPVYGVYSTFMQRTYDQISQDVCINASPVTFLVAWASIYGMNDVTHLGLYDIPMISHIPNLVYLAPTSREEYLAMLDWSIEQMEHPVAIRMPMTGMTTSSTRPVRKDYSNLDKYEVTKKGNKVAVMALGNFYSMGEKVIELLKMEMGVDATLINPIYISGTDEDLLNCLKENHDLVVTLEDGVIEGGFGEKIARFYGMDDMKIMNFGVKKAFYDRYNPEELARENHLTAEQIVDDIRVSYKKYKK